MVEIRDKESFEAWLEALPDEVGEARALEIARTLASRSALRVLPPGWVWFDGPEAQEVELTPLPLLRCNLICAVAAMSPTEQIMATAYAGANSAIVARAAVAARAAADAANAAANAATINTAAGAPAVRSIAVRAAAAAAAAAIRMANMWKVLSSDAEALLTGPPDPWPLWPETFPFANAWAEIQSRHEDDPDWRFWLDWYQAALDGTRLPTPLLEKIALLPSKDWNKGPAHINPIIREIYAAHRARRKLTQIFDPVIAANPYALRVVLPDGAARLGMEPTQTPDLEQIVKAMRDALATFLRRVKREETGNTVSILTGCLEHPIKQMRKDIKAHQRDPQRLFDTVGSGLREMGMRLAENDLTHNPLAMRMRDELDRALADICVASSDVLAMDKARTALQFERAGQDEVKRAVQMMQGMQKDSDRALAAYCAYVVQTVSNPVASSDDKRDALYAIRALLPQGAKMVMADDLARKESGKKSRFGAAADAVIKGDKVVDVVQEANVEFGISDWPAAVYSEIVSGNLWGWV